MNELAASLTLHVVTLTAAAMIRTNVFITCGRFLIDNILVYKSLCSKPVQASVDRSLSDIDALYPEVIGYLLARKMRALVILQEIQYLA